MYLAIIQHHSSGTEEEIDGTNLGCPPFFKTVVILQIFCAAESKIHIIEFLASLWQHPHLMHRLQSWLQLCYIRISFVDQAYEHIQGKYT